uniref:Small ribosomal subunit protein uS7c n=1 Tax=Chloroparvula japonica TaxID=1411623 RepID=A0A4D6C351_9CHLO|nr:ribosomal protein S7 [Chloroparvula japonica]QBX98155.1 ribosomal protein S7 [Chloroparvula japonica]
MARKRISGKRVQALDPKYQNKNVQSLVNHVLKTGKKQLAYRLVYKSLELAQMQTDQDALEILEEAINQTTPSTVVKARRIRGSAQQVPRDIKPETGRALAIRWLVASARARNNLGMANKLANELVDASRGQGGAVRKRQETHRMAESNRQSAG